jgi:hypothetical protein
MGESLLEFRLRSPWVEPLSRGRILPSTKILDSFLRLAKASDEDILAFASRYGALQIFCETAKEQSEEEMMVVESCAVWRYFAGCIGSLLRIAAAYHDGSRPRLSDWEVIGNCPIEVVIAKRESIDLLSPFPFQGDRAWSELCAFVRKGTKDKRIWELLVNTLLGLGRVRPHLSWEGSGGKARPQLKLSGPNLLSYLGLQLCLTACKLDSFAMCSYCSQLYLPPLRAPKAGQKNFCPDCRKAGVPVRIAQRDRRERRRELLRSGGLPPRDQSRNRT